MHRENHYYSGQGRVLLAERDPVTGRPLGFTEVGNVSELTMGIETSSTNHREAQTGLRTVDKTLIQEVSATCTMTLESIFKENLALAVWGEDAISTSKTVSDEPHFAGPGTIVALEHMQVSAIQVTTSGDNAVELVEGVDYDVFNADAGSIKLRPESTVVTQAGTEILVSYEAGEYQAVEGLTLGAQPERYIRFEGLNTADEGKPVVVEVFKAGIQPLASLALINDEIAQMEITTNVLRDGKRQTGSKFFRERMVA